MKKGMFIAGIIVLATILFWGSPGGFEWIAIMAQIAVGTVLIVKSRTKAKPMPQT